MTLFRTCANLPGSDTTTGTAAATVLRGLARRILADEVNELNKQLTAVLKACAPALLQRHGVGPDTAAALDGMRGGWGLAHM